MIYFDNSATTKPYPEALETYTQVASKIVGNPSSLHRLGDQATRILDASRQQIADLIGKKSDEIFFTSGGTEGDNWVIKGVAFEKAQFGKHIIVSAIEHPAVKESALWLKSQGFEVDIAPVDEKGFVDVKALASLIRPDTTLVSIMAVNNEIGSIQPIQAISELLADKPTISFHVDAVQTMGKVEIYPERMGIDLLSFSGHKFHAPKGIGVLYKRDGVRLARIITGGNQEGKRRPGTSNVPYIVGLAKALQMAVADMKEVWDKEEKLRDYFEDEITKRIPEIKINGKGARRLPGTSSITFKYLEGESMLLNLSLKGIAVSSGSACSSDSLQPSHVLLAMGIPAEFAHGTLRFSLSKYTTKEEIDYTIESLVEIIEKLRELSPLWKTFKDNKLTNVASFD